MNPVSLKIEVPFAPILITLKRVDIELESNLETLGDPTAMSLDKYMANNTTEDDASFAELVEENEKKQRIKLAPFFPSLQCSAPVRSTLSSHYHLSRHLWTIQKPWLSLVFQMLLLDLGSQLLGTMLFILILMVYLKPGRNCWNFCQRNAKSYQLILASRDLFQ